MVIVLQYIEIANHYFIHLKLKLYVNYISIWKTAFLISKKKNDKASQQREKIAFSGNGAETTGYPHTNE